MICPQTWLWCRYPTKAMASVRSSLLDSMACGEKLRVVYVCNVNSINPCHLGAMPHAWHGQLPSACYCCLVIHRVSIHPHPTHIPCGLPKPTHHVYTRSFTYSHIIKWIQPCLHWQQRLRDCGVNIKGLSTRSIVVWDFDCTITRCCACMPGDSGHCL